jgi:hypothetical protein
MSEVRQKPTRERTRQRGWDGASLQAAYERASRTPTLDARVSIIRSGSR